MLKLRKNKKGFTLVELIVVIAIMAVLAGTVAGVTVSQLNKNTDKSNRNQAKGIADFVSTYVIENEKDFITSEKFSSAGVTEFYSAVEKQYKGVKHDGTINATKATFSVVVTEAAIIVAYNGKQSGATGDVFFSIDTEGVITETLESEVTSAGWTALTATSNPTVNPGGTGTTGGSTGTTSGN